MDWQALIDQFTTLTREDVMLFAPPRDMEQALNIYNRAIFNISSDSMDIALIALRKLAATYPMFPQASLLLSFCQAKAGQYDEALENLDHALLAGLPPDLHQQAQDSQASMIQERKQLQQSNAAASSGASPFAAIKPRRKSSSGVLEKTDRRSKVRMASEKERQSVIRRGEFPTEIETNVKTGRDPVEILRIALPIAAGVLLAAFLVFAGIRWLPGLFSINSQDSTAEARLSWLISRLDSLAGKNSEISQLLEDYQTEFQTQPLDTTSPATTATTAATAATTAATTETTSPATTAPTTSATTTADPAIASLQEASLLYDHAAAIRPTDVLAAADDLLTARAILANVPENTTAPEVAVNAGTLRASVESLISAISGTAADKFRLLGKAEFEKSNYESALEYFLKAYRLNPRTNGGGVAYYCGRCYQLLGDYASAKPYYDYVVKSFAGRDIAVYAANRLKQMGF